MKRMLVTVAVVVAVMASAKDYENFDLPKTSRASVESHLNYNAARVSLHGKNARVQERSFDAKEYLSVKEAFLAERRDQAIKLLRQQLDSNLAANRDNILLRLGQLYAEKYMELSYRENELYTQQLNEFEKHKAVDKGAKTPQLDGSRSRLYLKDSLGLFYSLEKDYPRHPKIDEVVFFIGFVEMESGHPEKGVRYLERVIHQYPSSRKFEEATVYLGDYYFDKSKFRDAQAKFRILLNRPTSPLHHYAKYKLAWCELNVGEKQKAVAELKLVVSQLAGTQDKAKFNLREQAIKDLVIFFAEAEQVDEAFNYFSEVVGRDKAVENLRLLADILRSKARDDAAVRAYTRLLNEFPNAPDAPLIALGIFDSLTRLGRTDQAVQLLVKTLDRYGQNSDWAKSFPKEKEKDLASILNQLQTESEKAGLFMHQSAQKSQNKMAYTHALRIYTAILNAFPNHPSRKNIGFYRGEILFEQGAWLAAAESYMIAAKTPPKDKRSEEGVYSALEALDKLTQRQGTIQRYTKEEQKNVSLDAEELPVAEKRFIEVSDFYVKEYPQGARVVDVRFRVAAILYKYHHFDAAQAQFKDIALKHPRHRSATTAAHIVLDIDNIKKNYDALAQNAALFAKVEGLGDKEFHAEMAQLQTEVAFKRVEKLEAENKWAEAAEAYLVIYRASPSGPLAERSLYNAYVSFEKAGDVAKTAEMSKLFIAKFPKSAYTQKMQLTLAKNAERQYDFETAQRLYLDYARKYPKDKDARKALYNAAVFAEMLEMNKLALSLYNEYSKDRATTAEEKKAIQISEAKLYRKDGDLEKMALTYRRLAREAKSIDEKLTILAELVHQYETRGKLAEKEQLLKEMRWMYKSAGDAKVTGQGAYYIAETEFRGLSDRRKKYDEVKLRFPPEDLVYLLKRKEKLLVKLGEAYDGVVDVGVPEWGVAALLEKSDSYENFVRTFRAVKIPASYKDDVRAQAEQALKGIDEKLVKPLELKAQEIAKTCVERAAQFHVVNEYAAKCRERMKKDPNVADPAGIMPQPTYWSTRHGEKNPEASDDKELEELVSLDSKGQNVEAERKIKQYLAKHPTEKRAVFVLATHYLRVNKKEIANYLFTQLEKDNSFKWRSLLYNNLGMLALKEKNRPAAIGYFEKAVQAEPPSAAPHVNLGALYLQSRSWADAERQFEKAREIDPAFEDAALGLGYALEGQGKFEEAHKVYADHIEGNSDAVPTLFNDSIVLGNRLKKREEAAQQMLRYIQKGGKETAKAHEIIQTWR